MDEWEIGFKFRGKNFYHYYSTILTVPPLKK